jgi:hypothetical protein
MLCPFVAWRAGTTTRARADYIPQSETKNVASAYKFGVRNMSCTAYGFLMISPNLHDIWVMFFLNLSQELKLVL